MSYNRYALSWRNKCCSDVLPVAVGPEKRQPVPIHTAPDEEGELQPPFRPTCRRGDKAGPTCLEKQKSSGTRDSSQAEPTPSTTAAD